MKRCSRCHQFKPSQLFWRSKNTPDGKDPRCIPCSRDRRQTPQARRVQKAYRANPRARAVLQHYEQSPSGFDRYLQRYAIGRERWDELLLSQRGRCGACARALSNDKHTHIDHDHRTGVVRGVLCRECNVALGCVHDSIERLEALKQYLVAAPAAAR